MNNDSLQALVVHGDSYLFLLVYPKCCTEAWVGRLEKESTEGYKTSFHCPIICDGLFQPLECSGPAHGTGVCPFMVLHLSLRKYQEELLKAEAQVPLHLRRGE